MDTLTLAAVLCTLAISAQAAAPSVVIDADRTTGSWNRLAYGGKNLIAGPSQEADITWDGGTLPPIERWTLASLELSDNTLTVECNAGPWRITTRRAIVGSEVRTTARFQWNGDSTITVRGTALRTPALRLSPGRSDSYVVPGNYPIERRTFGELHAGHETREVGWTRGDYGMAVVESPTSRLALIAGYVFGHDQARIAVEERDNAVCIVHHFDTALHVAPGQVVEVGTQVVRIVSGDSTQVMRAVSDFSNHLDNGPPAIQPAHLRKLVLYEAHPWGRLEDWNSGDRGWRYDRLTTLLPYYNKLGVTGIWILPVSWPPPWVYNLPAFDRIAPENGTPEQLKQFVAAAHRAGIKAMIDLVVYGISPSSPEVERDPADVWCMDEQGKRAIVWGGAVLAADCSNRRWQDRISEVAGNWARDFGFDGTRLDCMGWGQTANWSSPGRANDAVAYGGLQLNKVVRDSMRRANPDAVTLPEGGKPLVFRNSDMVFDYPLYLAMRDMTWTPDVDAWIRRTREWLEWERHCYPSKALGGLVRFLENHDTVASAQYFGVGPSQALMAICTLIQGTPLIYQEQEVGFAEDLAAWIRLRNSEPCFYAGEADYHAVTCSESGVFCFLRKSATQVAIVAVNMTGKKIACRLSWDAALSQRLPTAVSGLADVSMRVRKSGAKDLVSVAIDPYRPTVVMLERAAAATQRRSAPRTTHGSWYVDTAEGRLEGTVADVNALVGGGRGGTDALPTLRRAWNPLAEGLLDGSTTAVVGVRAADGTDTRKTIDARAVTGVRLAMKGPDRSLDVSVEPASAILTTLPARPKSPGAGPRVLVGPQFIQLRGGGTTLTLSRSHGGVPVVLAGTGSPDGFLRAGADAYADQGLTPNGGFASADGETNPRLAIESTAEEVSVTFRGAMKGRSWNGVQTCPDASPACRYRLTYRVDKSGQVTVENGVTPQNDVPAGWFFHALRIPLQGVTGWRCGTASGAQGSGIGKRVAQTDASSGAILEVAAGKATLRVEPGSGLRNAFLIDEGAGNAALFLAHFDGRHEPLKAGQETSGTVSLRIAQ